MGDRAIYCPRHEGGGDGCLKASRDIGDRQRLPIGAELLGEAQNCGFQPAKTGIIGRISDPALGQFISLRIAFLGNAIDRWSPWIA